MRLIPHPHPGGPGGPGGPGSERLSSRLVDEASGEAVEFFRSLSVGRDPHNDLVLRHPEVSARHAVFQWREGRWRIQDLRSRNGTTLNGRRVSDWRAVSQGDVVRFATAGAWRAESLVRPADVAAAVAFVEDLSSRRWVPVCQDRFLIGVSEPCDLVLPEWLAEPAAPIRVVLYEETGDMWLAAHSSEGLGLDGGPFPDEPVRLDRTRKLSLGTQSLAVFPASEAELVAPTASAMRRTKQYDLSLHLSFVGPGDGVIRADHPDGSATVHGEQRFVLVYLLARRAGQWIHDDELGSGLWGRDAADRDPSALRKIIHDTRKAFTAQGVDGWFIEKTRGRTRIRLSPDRVTIERS